MKPKYNRILLKLSGESLAGDQKTGIDFDKVVEICKPIKKCVDAGVQVGIVVGGGNFWRGRSSGDMDRTRADHMGMLATAINALGVADALEQLGCVVRVQTAISMRQVAEPYIRNKAMCHLESGKVVIFGCGTGNPFFSTDTAAALRANEIEADIMMKATMVDGVYEIQTQRNMMLYHSMRFSIKTLRLWTAQQHHFVKTTNFLFSYSALKTRRTFIVQYAVKTSVLLLTLLTNNFVN